MNESLIQRLWNEHRNAPFPATARGMEVAGEDLVSLDSYAAGIIQTAAEGQSLQPEQEKAVDSTLEALRMIVPQLSGETRLYFERLLMALQSVKNGE